jgi:hypothetical protein
VIGNYTFAHFLCENSNISEVLINPFTSSSEIVKCDELEGMNLDCFAEQKLN